MKKIKFFALWALLLTPPLLLSGCGDDATDDPTPGKTPVLTIKDNALGVINVEAAGQTVTLNYEVADAVEGKLAVAKSDSNNAAHFRPQVAFIRKALPFSGGGEGLTGKAA